MNIQELVEIVADEAKSTKVEAEAIIREAFHQIEVALAKGEEVKIANFGSFKSKVRAARSGINPATKEPIQIPESKQVGFKAAKHLKDSL